MFLLSRIFIRIYFLSFLVVSGFTEENSRQFAFSGINFTKSSYENNDFIKNFLIREAHWSNVAYCPKGQILSWSCGASCEIDENRLSVKYYKSDALSGSALYLGVHENTSSIVVSYRGTHNFGSFINDLLAMKLDYRYKSGKVHLGFYRSYSRLSYALKEYIRDLLSDVHYKNHSIIVVGHSYGGALATFFALELKLDHSITNKVLLRTFEAPRIGDADFADFFTRTFFKNPKNYLPVLRITNNNDPVINLPPSSFGFKHYPHEIWLIDGQVRLDRCDDLFPESDKKLCREDPSCSISKVLWNFGAHIKLWDINFGYSCKI